MVEENVNYDGKGLKGALWTIAGTSIAAVAQRLVGGAFGGAGMPAMAAPAAYGGAVATGLNAVGEGVVADLLAKNAKLEAEKYSDNAALEQSNRLLANYLKPYGDAIAAGQVQAAKMQAEIDCLKKTQELELRLMAKDIDLAKQEAKCASEKNALAIATLGQVVAGITKVVVPNGSVCPGWGAVKVTPETAAAAAA